MAYVIRMPKLGVEMEEGVVLEWHADEGERVGEGDLIAEIESEKTQAEVAAREDGVLRRILMDVEEAGEPGAAMGIVAGPDEPIDDLLAEAAAEPAEEPPGEGPDTPEATGGAGERDAGPAGTTDAKSTAQADAAGPADPAGPAERGQSVRATPKAKDRARDLDVDLETVEGTGPKGAVTADDVLRAARGATDSSSPDARPADSGGGTIDGGGAAATATAEPRSAAGVKASPRARKRAAELDVDVTTVSGSGPAGSVVEADVEQAAASATTEPQAAETPGDVSPARRTVREERGQSRMRQTIARRLHESWREAPHVTVDRRVDAEPLFAAVEAANAAGHDVSVTDVLLRAVSATLAEHPAFNATFEDGTHTIYEEHNVGVAVDVDDGLITPVIPDVGSKTVDEIAAVRGELTDRALRGAYTADDLAGGTFTVSNLGVFGVDSFTPIINPPEVAILGVNAVEERPVKGDRGGIAFRRQIGFSLSFDHRVVDGADAARFLETLSAHLEDAVALVP